MSTLGSSMLEQSSAGVAADATTSVATPPIVQIFQLATNVASKGFSVARLLTSSLWSLARTAVAPLFRLASLATVPILYLLGPVVVLATILFDVFVASPYRLFVAGAKAVYPLYVFVGIACICAGCVGLCARGLTYALQRWAVGAEAERGEEAFAKVKVEGEVVPARRPRKKRVVIKEERDSD